jgi:hypothetical protein
VSSAAITFSVASQTVFIVVYFVIDSFGNFWIHPRNNEAIKSRTMRWARHVAHMGKPRNA